MEFTSSAPPPLPSWVKELIRLYESNAYSQFVLTGNINDHYLFPYRRKATLGGLIDLLLKCLLQPFDVILSYDLGNGVLVEKGGEILADWPHFKRDPTLPREPRAAIDFFTHYFRYVANLAALKGKSTQIACIIRAANLAVPALPGALNYDLSAMALLIREWSREPLLTRHAIATLLLTENLNDLHQLIVNNPRCARIEISLPTPEELQTAFKILLPQYDLALAPYSGDLATPARQLAGATFSAIEATLKLRQYDRAPLTAEDLVALKKRIVENECHGLIEFIETNRNLDDLHGMDAVKQWLRQDIALWEKNNLTALPKGYLLCGPVGTGKTFLVECLAGEAGVPIVKFKNFRDKWIGSTESNLEKIFRLLEALGRCFVFIDEADQALGRRQGAGGGDSGVSGRVYSMMAEQMSRTDTRGRIIWILASSRPDLIEVDLKRPGRIDIKIPIFPTTTPEESFQLLRALCAAQNVELPACAQLKQKLPQNLTAGAAEALAVKIYRTISTRECDPLEAVLECLNGYQNPIAPEIMKRQIQLAIEEASHTEFIPKALLS